MLAPVFWLVASSLQNDGQLARGSYDLLHPTFQAFRDMWKTIDFERYFINSAIICTVAALLATAFASTAGYALARFPLPRRAALRAGGHRHAADPGLDVPAAGVHRLPVDQAARRASSSSTRAWG